MKTTTLKYLIVIIFILVSCSNPERSFQKAKKINTIESYKDFIEKYPESEFSIKADKQLSVLVLDTLITNKKLESFENYANSCKFDSLVKIANNYCSAIKLAEKADTEYDSILTIKELDKRVERYRDIGLLYLESAKIYDSILYDTTSYGIYKKAAYIYYKASRVIQTIGYNESVDQMNMWIAGKTSSNSAKKKMAYTTTSYNYIGIELYQKSVDLFRKANMADHAEWMISDGTTKNFVLDELEKSK